MLLRAAPAFSLLNARGESPSPFPYSASSRSSSSFSWFLSVPRISPAKISRNFVVCASKDAKNRTLTGVVFEPFVEVKKELDLVPTLPHISLARQKYADESEGAINEQIKSFFTSYSVYL